MLNVHKKNFQEKNIVSSYIYIKKQNKMAKLQNCFITLPQQKRYDDIKSCKQKKNAYIHKCSNIRKLLRYDKYSQMKIRYHCINLKEALIINYCENSKDNTTTNNNNDKDVGKSKDDINNLKIFINDLFKDCFITSMYIFEYISLIGWSNGIISVFDKYLNNILNKKISNSTIKNISMNKKENALCFMDNSNNLFLIYLNIRNNYKKNNNNLFFESTNENYNRYQHKLDELNYFNKEKYMNLNKKEQSFIKAFICNNIIRYNIKYLNSCIINPFFDNYHNNNICILSSNKIVSILYIYEFHINNTVLFKEQNILNFYWYHCYIFICTEFSVFVINFFDKTKVAQILLNSYNDFKSDLLIVQINQSYINEKVKINEEKCINDEIFDNKKVKTTDEPHDHLKSKHKSDKLNKEKLGHGCTESEYDHLFYNKKKENNLVLIHTCTTQKGVYIIAKEKNIKIIKIEKINGIEKISILSNFCLDNHIISLCAFHDTNNFDEKEFFISAIVFNKKTFMENERRLKINNSFLEHQILTNNNSLIYRNSIKINNLKYINRNNIICNYNNDTSYNTCSSNDNYNYFKNYFNYLNMFQYIPLKDIFDSSMKKKPNNSSDISLYIYGYNTFLQFRPKTIKEYIFELVLKNKRNIKNILIILNELKKNTNYKKELTDIGLLFIFSFIRFKKYFLATKIFLVLHKDFHNKKKVIYDIIKIFFLHRKVYILSLFYLKLKQKEKDLKRKYYRIRETNRIRKRKKKKIRSLLFLFYMMHKKIKNKSKKKTDAILRKKKKKKNLCVQKEKKKERKKKFFFFVTKNLFNKFLVFLLCTNVFHFKNIYEESSNSYLNAHFLSKHIIFLLKDNFEFVNKQVKTIYNSFHFTLSIRKKKNNSFDLSYKKSGAEKKILLDILLDIYFKFNIYPFNKLNKNNLILFNESSEKCKKIAIIRNLLKQNKCLIKNKITEKDDYKNNPFHHEYNNKNRISKNMKYAYNEKTDYINIEKYSYNQKKKKKKYEEKEIIENEKKEFQNGLICKNNNLSNSDVIIGNLYKYSFFKKEYDNIKKVEILKMLLHMKNENIFIYLKQCDFQVMEEIINKNIIKLCNLNIKKTVMLLITKKENKYEYIIDPHQIVKKLKKKPFFLYNFLKEIKDIKYIRIYINIIIFLMFIFEPLLLMNFLKLYYKYISFKKFLFYISFFNYLYANYSPHTDENIYYCNNIDRKSNNKIIKCTNDNYSEETRNIYTENSIENRIINKIIKKDKYFKDEKNQINEAYPLTDIYNENFIKSHNFKKKFSTRLSDIFFKNEYVVLLYNYLLNKHVKKENLLELFNLIKEESIRCKSKLNFFLNLKAYIYLKFGYINRAINIYLKLNNYLQIFLIAKYHNVPVDEDIIIKIKNYLDTSYYATSFYNVQKKYLYKKWYNNDFFKEKKKKKKKTLLIKDEYFCCPDENNEISKHRSIILMKKKFSLNKKCKINELKNDIISCFKEDAYFSRKKNKVNYNDVFTKRKKEKKKKFEITEIENDRNGIHNIIQDEMNKNKDTSYKINPNLKNYIIKNINCNILDKEIMYKLYSKKKKKKKKRHRHLNSKNRQLCKRNNNDTFYKKEENHYLNKEIVIKNYFINNINYEMNYLTLISLLEELFYKNELCENFNKILIINKKSVFNFLNEIKKKGYTIYNGKAKKELKRHELNLIDINDYYFLDNNLKKSNIINSHYINDQYFKNNEKIFYIQKQIPPNYYLYDQIHRNPFISKFSSFCSSCLNNIYLDYHFNNKKIKYNNIVFFFCNHLFHLKCIKKSQISCNLCH